MRAFLYFCFFVFFFVQFHIFCLTLCNLKNSECHVITARQRSCGKVMYSHVCVCLFTAGPSDHYPSLQTCSNLFIRPHCTYPYPGSNIWWPLKELQSVQVGVTRILLECFLVANTCARGSWIGLHLFEFEDEEKDLYGLIAFYTIQNQCICRKFLSDPQTSIGDCGFLWTLILKDFSEP